MPPERRRPNEPGEQVSFYKLRYRYRQTGFEYTRTDYLRGQQELAQRLDYLNTQFKLVGGVAIYPITEFEYIQATRPTD